MLHCTWEKHMIRYRENAEIFMKEFSRQHAELEQLIDREQFEKANQIMLEMLEKVLPGLPFRLAKPKTGKEYILELTTTLDPLRRILAFYLCSRLPESLQKRWRFYYSHPAFKGTFSKDGMTFFPEEVKVVPSFDDKKHRMHLKVEKTEKLKGLSEQDSFLVLYMMLTDALGETAVDAYLGSIQFLDRFGQLKARGKERISLDRLDEKLHKECRKRGWIDPNEIYFIAENYTYRTRKLTLRQDITEGISFCLDLLNEEGQPKEKQLGRCFLRTAQVGLYSVVLPTAPSVSREKKQQEREVVEKEINRILSERQSGMLINAALGNAHSYVDFLVYDAKTLEEIESWAAQQPHLEVLAI